MRWKGERHCRVPQLCHRLRGRSASESGRLCQGDGDPEGGNRYQRGASVVAAKIPLPGPLARPGGLLAEFRIY